MVDPLTIATTSISLLDQIVKALKQDKPNVAEARTLLNQLQQHIDEVRARNLQLERDVLNVEKQNFQLQKQVETNETWRQQLEKLEKCQTLHGKWVLREKGTEEPLICPNCIHDKRITFIQYTHRNLEGRAYDTYSCPTCKVYF